MSSSSAAAALPPSFQAWRVHEQDDGTFVGAEETIHISDEAKTKDDSGIWIRVTHSSLNFKDALSASGNKGVTRNYPHTPGIDAAGIRLDTNEPVLVTGYDLGMNTDGGFGEYIQVPSADWIVDIPRQWQPQNDAASAARTSMIYGTAGLTAGLLVQKLVAMANAVPGQTVAVTGASGAVGSVVTELLGRCLGMHVVAITGKSSAANQEFLKTLGAAEIVGREVLEPSKKPLLKPRFDHAIDTVGGAPLAELLKQIKPDGAVACCGNAAGLQLDTTVLPFILRGVSLLGVDSVQIDRARKTAIWQKLANEWACPHIEATAKDIGRKDLQTYLEAFAKGESSGKIVLDHSL